MTRRVSDLVDVLSMAAILIGTGAVLGGRSMGLAIGVLIVAVVCQQFRFRASMKWIAAELRGIREALR